MPRYTVQCGYHALWAHTAVVDADSPEAACEAAIEAANDSSAWKSVDYASGTFVDALAPGDGVDPWNARGVSVLPVPRRHGETAAVAGRVAAYARELREHLALTLASFDEGGEPTIARFHWTQRREQALRLLRLVDGDAEAGASAA